MPPQLTERRQDILRTIARLARRYGRAPTTAEVARELGMTRQGASEHVQALRTLGLLDEREDQLRQRHVVLTTSGEREVRRLDGLPVVGQIAAGPGAHAEQSLDAYVALIADVIDLKPGDFMLTVRGDSMTGEGIRDGDAVVIRPACECLSGEIAAVLLPNDNVATLKRFYKDGDTITLVSENPDFAPMTFHADEVRVQGCLVGHIARHKPRKTLRGN